MTYHTDDPTAEETPEKLLHDIITPLIIVKMNAELLGDYLPQLIKALGDQPAFKALLPDDEKITEALLQAPQVIANNIETVLKKHRQLSKSISASLDNMHSASASEADNNAFTIHKTIHNILLVEDEAVHRDIGISLLSQQFHLDCATNGLEAIEMCKHSKYDLILMDMHMPKMNGLEATEELRTFIDSKTIIIGLTSLPLGKKRNELLEIGFDAFLEKPLKLENFKHLLGIVTDNNPA
jgi:CheY-like chemotaxis protein